MLTRFNTLLEFAMIRGGKRFRDYCIHVRGLVYLELLTEKNHATLSGRYK